MANEAKRKAALDEDSGEHRSNGASYLRGRGWSSNTALCLYDWGSESIGVELILAGASFYLNDEVAPILNDISAQLKPQSDWEALRFEVAEQGSFTLRKAHASWATEFMRGALDYYKVADVPALQVVPDEAHWTIDVPDLSAPWSATTEPVWRWLHEPWAYPVPEAAVAVTDLAALRGERVTEAMRWEEDEWEMFVGDGPDIPKDELRMVPLGTLVGADESLAPVVYLPVGEGIWRDPAPDSEWRPWLNRKLEIDAAGTGTNE
jgi:hypothetical protein